MTRHKKISERDPDRQGKRIWAVLFIACAFCMMAVPGISTIWIQETASSENRQLAAAPVLKEDSRWNLNLLGDAGAWFEDHFAFRQALVQVQSTLMHTLFQTSSSDQVVAGKDGWLYYAGTMDDYSGTALLSEREIFNIVHNLQLMNHYVQSRGSSLYVCFAPNKNSVYPENMPDRYVQADQNMSNLVRVQAALKQAGIDCIDLLPVLRSNKEQELYYARDSHWNSRGALLAYNTLMEQMGLAHETYEQQLPEQTAAPEASDLALMLYPLDDNREEDIAYDWQYTWDRGDGDVMADWIQTSSQSGNGTLLMFRDSFAKAMIPYLSSQFATSVFDRTTPYNLLQIESFQPSAVIIERVERRIGSLQESAALIRMPVIANPEWTKSNTQNGTADIHLREDGDFIHIYGQTDESLLNSSTNIYVQLQGQTVYTYACFYVQDSQFDLYLPKEQLKDIESVNLLQENQGTFVSTASLMLNPEENS